MKTYLVGGAVRDQLLGLPVHEKDWVVVGGSPEMLFAQGYQQVGRDFPVFLHPLTHEEYALARTERKTSSGYYGFTCQFSPNVTLEEDLLRRDLTINAMARDEHYRLIDPFHGQRDITEKKLRHVSDAFVEDPLRVLRVARFAARYHHLGFQIAQETLCLMTEMVRSGELSHLVPERVWQECYRSLGEKNPEVFFLTLRSCGALEVLFPEIDRLFGVPQTPQYHPEIDTGIHTMMVLQEAVKLTDDPKVRFGALVHDLGKGLTPMNIWPRHIGHETSGVHVIHELCQRLRVPSEYREFAVMVCRFHITLYQLETLKPATIVKILERTDAFRRPEGFESLLLACEADLKGRLLPEPQDDHVRMSWQKIHKICAQISAKPFVEKGLVGDAIKTALHEARVHAVKEFLKVM